MFKDRIDAGRRLAQRLLPLAAEHPVVLALPRGGVPLGAEVARVLGSGMDVLVVRKIGAPWNPEFGFGAIGEGGVAVIDEQLAHRIGVDEATLRQVTQAEDAEVRRRVAAYRGDRPAPELAGRTVIVVDDGIATGSTLLAAVALLRHRHAGRIVVAAPVASASSVASLRRVADDVVVLEVPEDFRAVGLHYRNFAQVPDEAVAEALASVPPPVHVVGGTGRAAGGGGAHAMGGRPGGGAEPYPAAAHPAAAHPAAADGPPPIDEEVTVQAGVPLEGRLSIPTGAVGLVVFAHGSGSSRMSPRNLAVARALQARGIGTLLFDLLTEAEAADRRNVFDIDLLAARLVAATSWLVEQGFAERAGPGGIGPVPLPIGLFGASTGGGAAIVAAARSTTRIAAVVSRGGRPDLAGPALAALRSPTLLIVGSEDVQVLGLNRRAREMMRCPAEVAVVPHAGHLFSEPGALELVSRLAADWFVRHFTGGRAVAV